MSRRIELKHVLFAGGVMVMALIPPALKLSSYTLHIFIMIFYFAYLSSCWNLLGGFAGQHSMGHAAFVGLGAYTSTFLLLTLGLNPWIGMLCGGLIAGMAGLSLGYLSFRYRVKGLYFLLVTIAFAEILNILFSNIRPLGRASGLVVPLTKEGIFYFQFQNKAPYYYVVLAMLTFILLLSYVISRRKLGFYLIAIRENEEAARAVGIRVTKYKLLATTISAFLSAFGGTFYAQYTFFIDPSTILGIGLSVELLIYAIVGGVGTVFGPLVGAFLLYPLAELTRTLLGSNTSGVHLMFYGARLIVIVMFAPQGILGLFRGVSLPGRRRPK
jgi:branched-chain amino acid transport system permease protein